MELPVLMVLGSIVGAVLLGVLLLHVLLAIVLLPLKLGFALLKGIAAAVFVVPVFALATAVLIGLVAALLGAGFVVLVLHAIF
jgi:hypothetical protein